MNTLRISLILTIISLTVLWSSGSAVAEQLSEPKGLITFDMPDGWNNDRFSNGRHFTREGLKDDPNILAVVPERSDEYMTLKQMSEGRKQVHARQSHRLVSEKIIRINEFEVWEAVHEAKIRSQNVVLHTYLMFSDTVMVEVHLNASKEAYKKYLPDLRSVAKSVRSK